jgi:hypothetical protein
MIGTGYPYDGFEEMYPRTEPTPEWFGFGHKHLVYNKTPMRHLILVDGQQHSEIDVTDPDEPLDHVIADRLRGTPAERPHIPVSGVLTLVPTARPGARPDLESGQFQHPDTRPAVIMHHLFGARQRG